MWLENGNLYRIPRCIQSIETDHRKFNRYQSIKLVNWYPLVSASGWPIDNHTKTVHRLLSIGSATSNRRHARYLSDHPLFLDSPVDEIGKTNSAPVFSRQSVYPVILGLPTCPSLSFHVINARRPGGGFTEYKMHCQRLSSLPFWGERRWSVHCKQGEGRTRKRV